MIGRVQSTKSQNPIKMVVKATQKLSSCSADPNATNFGRVGLIVASFGGVEVKHLSPEICSEFSL